MSRESFRRDINREFDALSGSPSPALSARVRSALSETRPAHAAPIWLAGVAAGLIAAIVVGVFVVANFNRHQTSAVPGGQPTASPSATANASPSANPSASPTANPSALPSPTSPAGPYACNNARVTSTAPVTAYVTAVRTGTHSGYDQVTIQLSDMPNDVQIVPQSSADFTGGASGQPITLAGNAGILVTIQGTDGHTQYSGPTDFKTKYAVLQELRQVQDFEGTVQWALGLSHGACYSYTFLTNPTRLVIYIQNS